MKFKLVSLFLVVFNLSASDIKTCTLPEKFKGKIDTFIVNSNLSCGANIFINTLPIIGTLAKEKLSKSKQTDLVALGRQAYEELAITFAKTKISMETKDFKIPGHEGKNIKLRLYEGKEKGKVIVYVHGGGWRQGSLDTHDALCREISHRSEYTVIAVDYRLAPENPFPAGLDDVEKAFDWVLRNYPDSKVIICGDSAGGNLSTALAIRRLQENKKCPDGLLLIYPDLNLVIPEATDDPMATGYFLTQDRITDYVKNYLGKDYKQLAAENPMVSPVVAPDEILKALPPTLIVAGKYDPLTSISQQFVNKAAGAGADIEIEIVDNTIHIFAQFPELFEEANAALKLIARKANSI